MTWIRENKFLSGFFAALIVGVGVLGYLLYSASGKFTEVSETYNKDAGELKRLQTLAPYPDEGNLTKLRGQKDGYLAATADLQKTLAAIEFPMETMTPEQFQDKLRASVSKLTEKAAAADVKLPEKFYLGFETYQTSLPKADAAPALGQQLSAIEFLVNALIEDKVSALLSLVRTPLSQENQAAAAATPERAQLSRSAGAAPNRELIKKSPVLVTFLGEQSRVRKWVNDITSAKEQFYVIRLLSIKNENPKGPSRTELADTGAAAPPAIDPTTGAAASPTPNTLKFIVGTEKINVSAQIEILGFAPPAVAATK
ncbi:MAG: hypothetical protein QOD99_1975 [Chthoniobacter sp.]|jgi:hypothetical protein|nr:hypothetical protein [Chthoniobacter sp.]